MDTVLKLPCHRTLLFHTKKRYKELYFLVCLVSIVNKFTILKFIVNSILLTVFLLHFSCGGKSEVHISQTIIFEGKLYKIESKDPFSGFVFNTYPNGLKEYEGEYKNGKPNGLLIYWYENGNKMREGRLKEGTPVGRWITYNDDASIQETIDH